MHLSFFLAVSAMAAAVSTFKPPVKSFQKRELGVPSNGIVANGVAFGFVPCEGPDSADQVWCSTFTMSDIDNKLGAKSSTYGWYSQIDTTSYEGQSPGGDQLTEVLDDVVSSGAVFQPAVMPQLEITDFDSDVASQVKSVLEQFTDKGVEVWLRFGHEMNYYASIGQYTNDPSGFVAAWKLMYEAVADNDLIKMWWSPNIASLDNIAPWFPGSDYIDIVGIDCYPDSTQDLSSDAFSDCYSSFYQTYSENYNLPFAIGETAYSGPSANEAWLAQLVGQDMCDYPNYISASWFEFNQKSTNYLIVEGSSSLLAQTKTHLLDNTGTGTKSCGSSSGSGGGGSGSGDYPPDTCTWGCEGWDCSSGNPCQSAYSCVSGYCENCTWGCGGWDCSSSQPCNADYTCVGGICHHSGPATKR